MIHMFKKLFKQSKEEKIYAPIDGEIVKLEEVPDPVFSEKMMGEGIAIIPEKGEIYAPVAGKVVQIPETKHAIGLVTDEGTEILIHIGLETVNLKGKGFNEKVSVGDKVSVGQLLMEVDLDYVKENATSLITPIIITNSSDGDKHYNLTEDKVSKVGETVIITVAGN